MAPVPLKFVVSFSSQDDRHPVVNLLSGSGKKRWLSAPKLKTGHIEAVFELERPCVITHIDIGSVWCANVEVKVGRSSWAQGIPYKTVVPTVSLMSPIDCRNSNAFIKTRMFSASDFMEDVCNQEWDRLRIICRQPFRKDVQFGLSFIRITGNFCNNNNNTQVQSPNQDKNHSGSSTHSSPFSGAKTPRMEDVIPRHSSKTTPARTAELQNRLLKIASSAENGTANEVSLSRTARLVLAAADQSPKYSPTVPTQHNHKSRLLSNSVDSRGGPSFKAEAKHFLSCLQLTEEDLPTITIADLRHRLEKRKRRKLTRDEKKQFLSLTQDFLQAKFDSDTNEPENSDDDTDKFVSHVLNTPSVTDSSIERMSITEDIYKDDSSYSSLQLSGCADIFVDESFQSPKKQCFEPVKETCSPEVSVICDSDFDLGVSPQQHGLPMSEGKVTPCLKNSNVISSSVSVNGIDSRSPLSKTPREPSKRSRPIGSTSYKKCLTPKLEMLPIAQRNSPTQNSIVDSSVHVVQPNMEASSIAISQPNPSPNFQNFTIPKPIDQDVQILSEGSLSDKNSRTVLTPGQMPQATHHSATPRPSGPGKSSSANSSKTTTAVASRTTKWKIAATGSSNRRNCKREPVYKTRTVTVKVPSSPKRVASSSMITIHCIECGKMVPEPNYLLHQVRCKKLSKKRAADNVTTPRHPQAQTLRTPVYQTPPNMVIVVDEWRDQHIPRMVTCPICQQNFPEAEIQVHADLCAEL